MVRRPNTGASQRNLHLIDLITRIHRTGRGSLFRSKLLDGAAEISAEGELRTWDVVTTAYQSFRYTSRIFRLTFAFILIAASGISASSIVAHSRQMQAESILRTDALAAIRSAPKPIVTFNSTKQQMSCVELSKAQSSPAIGGVIRTISTSHPISLRMFCVSSNYLTFSRD